MIHRKLLRRRHINKRRKERLIEAETRRNRDERCLEYEAESTNLKRVKLLGKEDESTLKLSESDFSFLHWGEDKKSTTNII